MVTLHGADRPGLVHAVTRLLARHRFNISDLETHRTAKGMKAGYILFIEGNLLSRRGLMKLVRELAILGRTLNVHISIKPIPAVSL